MRPCLTRLRSLSLASATEDMMARISPGFSKKFPPPFLLPVNEIFRKRKVS